MAFLYFPGQTVDWKKARLTEVLEQLAAGKISTSGGAGDVNASFAVQASLDETRRKLIYDLSKEDPSTNWAQHLGTRQTKMIFADRWP